MTEHTPAPTPARSLYGFFLYLFSKTTLIVYLVWAVVPNYYLHLFNIHYYPDKYWSTAIPIQCLVALTLFAFLIYPSSNLMLTCNIDNYNTIADQFSHVNVKEKLTLKPLTKICVCDAKSKCFKYCHFYEAKENTVPQLQDLDLRFVCRKLYLDKHL
ncbi:phosphatidylinositol N-acetylglucosaminyltransferase subunit P [Battus philenor]|uniref:phosphatidylinositol N-acetylglucosaminyltransferase subunit P n=1 Tax=Battus philenor TaxID=42288 RepID=UPI0035CEE62F